MIEAVTWRSLTAETPLRSQISQCEICARQSGIRLGFYSSTSIFLCLYLSADTSYLPSSKCWFYSKDKRAKLVNLQNALSEIGEHWVGNFLKCNNLMKQISVSPCLVCVQGFWNRLSCPVLNQYACSSVEKYDERRHSDGRWQVEKYRQKICALLGCYAGHSGNCYATYRNKLSVPSYTVKLLSSTVLYVTSLKRTTSIAAEA